jgi:1-acyl-sn-glycerol-3-phosphate acyltransferase
MEERREIGSSKRLHEPLTFPVLDTTWFAAILVVLQIFLWWPIIKLASLRLIRKRFRAPQLKAERKTVYVIAANHQSAFDHFMILVSLPLGFFVNAAPYRFMTLNVFFKKLWLRTFLIFCGSFPAREDKRHIYGLSAAERFIRMGQTVLIFPEGTRNLPGTAEPKTGVTILAKHRNVKILPAKIMWYKTSHWKRWCTVSIGQPFKATDMTPQEIMDRIYDLP